MELCLGNLHTKKLNTAEERHQAQALVYSIYFEEMHFDINSFSMIGMKIVTDNTKQQKFLETNFSANSIWFGLFDKEQLIGCIAASNAADQYKRHQAEYYIENIEQVNQLYNNLISRAYYLGRFVLHKDYRHHAYSLLLAKAILQYCYEHQSPVVAVAREKEIKHYHKLIKLKKLRKARLIMNAHIEKCSQISWAGYANGGLQKAIKHINKIIIKHR